MKRVLFLLKQNGRVVYGRSVRQSRIDFFYMCKSGQQGNMNVMFMISDWLTSVYHIKENIRRLFCNKIGTILDKF